MAVTAPGQAVAPDPVELRAQVEAWLASSALAELIGRFDGPDPAAGLDALADWSSAHWNFRAGLERNFIDPSAIDDETEALVLALAPDLGLVRPEPPAAVEYDHVIVLGGLVRACVWRTEQAAAYLDSGTAAREVAAITGRRRLGEEEKSLLAGLGYPVLADEAEVVRAAMTRELVPDGFGPVDASPQETSVHASWSIESGTTTSGTKVNFVIAPSSDPENRRANTPDSYRFWAEQVGRLGGGERLLLVTSQIYVPFQQADAIRMLGLPYGCVVETVGIDHLVIDDRGLAQSFGGANYLQEINSALLSFRALVAILE